MKTILSISLWMIFILSIINCRGPEGPPGPQGPPGPRGPEGFDAPLPLVYEVPFILNSSNQWSFGYNFPTADLPYILEEDVALVYLLVGEFENDEGDWVDIWRLLPIMYFEQEGILNLVYDYTLDDVVVYAESNYTLVDEEIDGHFRVVIIPTEFSPNGRNKQSVNYENYEEVMEYLGLPNHKSSGTPLKIIKSK